MLKKIFKISVFIVVILVAVVYFQPDDFRVSRVTSINASTADIFPLVNDFHKWESWSPWAKIDPNAKNSFSGSEYGTGAEFAWAGNDEVGEGKMTLIESVPDQLIKIKLDFLKPFEATSNAEFAFKQSGPQSEVTWSMYGKRNFLMKAMGLVMDCDKMMGGEFEKGLADIKRIAEKNGDAH